MHNAACQQRISNYSTKHEKLAAERASIVAVFQKYFADLVSNCLLLQTTSKVETNRADKETMNRKRLFVTEESRKKQFGHEAGDSKHLESLQYKLECAIANESRG